MFTKDEKEIVKKINCIKYFEDVDKDRITYFINSRTKEPYIKHQNNMALAIFADHGYDFDNRNSMYKPTSKRKSASGVSYDLRVKDLISIIEIVYDLSFEEACWRISDYLEKQGILDDKPNDELNKISIDTIDYKSPDYHGIPIAALIDDFDDEYDMHKQDDENNSELADNIEDDLIEIPEIDFFPMPDDDEKEDPYPEFHMLI